jgi:hypothetical protein
MKISTLALAAILGLSFAGSAIAEPLTSVSEIRRATDVRVMLLSPLGVVDGRRAEAVAGLDVVQLQFVGHPTNQALERELVNVGFDMDHLVALYSDVDGKVWAYVKGAKPIAFIAGLKKHGDDDDDDDDHDDDDHKDGDDPCQVACAK